MGYYATWGGMIKFKVKPSKEIITELKHIFNETYYDSDRRYFDFGGEDKYDEEKFSAILEKINPITERGEIEFTGEDNSHWRWIFKDGLWKDESGYVYYDSEINEARENREEFIGRIIDLVQDCIDDPKGETICGEWYDEIYDELYAIMKAWKVL